MNLILYFLIISNAAKKIEYNYGLPVTLRLVFKVLVVYSCPISYNIEIYGKLLPTDERIQRNDVERNWK